MKNETERSLVKLFMARLNMKNVSIRIQTVVLLVIFNNSNISPIEIRNHWRESVTIKFIIYISVCN